MPPRVLVVDDDDMIRETLVDLLTDEGYEVGSAANGQQALEAMRARPPCLVLLDLMMPVLDGWQVAREMQSDAVLSSIPLCIITATPHSAPSHAGCVLSKPVTLERVLAAVGERCGHVRSA